MKERILEMTKSAKIINWLLSGWPDLAPIDNGVVVVREEGDTDTGKDEDCAA